MADPGISPNGTSADSTSTSLLVRVKDHDPGAWRSLVDLYSPLAYRWCRQSGLQSDDAADLLQEVFSTLATGIEKFRSRQRRGSFRAWLKVITRNKIHDFFRRLREQPPARGGTAGQLQMLQLAQPTGEDASTGQAADHERAEEAGLWHRGLDAVRAEFEPRTWAAFWRVAVDGQAPADVAGELDLSVDAVYQAKSRVLRRLRRELSDLETLD